MSEISVSKLLSAAVAAFAMQWAKIPSDTWMLGLMMLIDFLMGNGVAVQDGTWKPRTFFNGVMRKCSAFLMLGALAIVKEKLYIDWDLVGYFLNAAIVYEFMSAAQSHVKLHGPGWQWIEAFSSRVRTFLADRKAVITQDSISQSLAKQKDEGEQARQTP